MKGEGSGPANQMLPLLPIDVPAPLRDSLDKELPRSLHIWSYCFNRMKLGFSTRSNLIILFYLDVANR